MRRKHRPSQTASLRFEKQYFRAGYHVIAGIDEVGRGPLAGPVAAAAVVLPLQREDLRKLLKGVRDSKTMSAMERQAADAAIKDIAVTWGIGHCSAKEIDESNILLAARKAMGRALDDSLTKRDIRPDALFVDFMPWPEQRDYHVCAMVNGDRLSLSIACASVIAKVWRDKFMRELDARYPQYGFAQHKGYASPAHLLAIEQHGPCEHHRMSFKPMSEMDG